MCMCVYLCTKIVCCTFTHHMYYIPVYLFHTLTPTRATPSEPSPKATIAHTTTIIISRAVVNTINNDCYADRKTSKGLRFHGKYCYLLILHSVDHDKLNNTRGHTP